MNKELTIITVIALIAFYLAWGIPQLLVQKMDGSTYPDFLFSTVFTGITGCLVPILIKNKFDLTYNRSVKRRILGILILILTILFGTIGSGAFIEAVKIDYSFLLILKYILLFIPMSLGISLFAFHLIPHVIDKLNTKAKDLITVVSIGVFFFIGFLIDSVFGDFELAGIMGVLGILFGLSYIFIRNFWIVYLGFFLTMLTNTLAENKYDEHSYWIVIMSTLISLIIIAFDLLETRKKLYTDYKYKTGASGDLTS
jgi:hypothetical protein